MNQKKKHGMWLRQTETGQKKRSDWILSMGMALLASELLLLTAGELTGFYMLYTPWIMMMTAGCVCIVYGMIIRLQKLNWFYPGVLFLLFLFVLFCGKMILNGFSMFWNQMGNIWTAGSGWVLPELEVSVGTSQETICLLLFSILVGSIVALLCCALVSFEKRVLAVTLPVMLLAGMLFFYKNRTFTYMIPLLVLAICLLLCSGRKGEVRPFTATVSRWIPVLIGCVLLLVLAATPDMENWASQIGKGIQEKLHVTRYETSYTTLPEGDFSDYTEKDGSKQTALVVTMEQPEELYLRGFTGAVFHEDTWSALDTEILAEHKELLYWMNQNGWNPHAQYEQAASLIQTEDKKKETAKTTVTVQNLNACSQYLYVPYNLCAGKYLEAEHISPDSVTSDGTRTYLYSTLAGGTERIEQTLQYLQEAKEQEVQEYLQAENAYREFVYRYYLEIPQEVKAQLLTYWEEAAAAYGEREELTYQQAQECAMTFIKQCFPEEGEAEILSLPLPVAQGSSYQYATVAALTLRYFGIPARYVEGYRITPEMAENVEENHSIKVDESCGGAWVEVYQDGIGWLPMEVTQGLEEKPQTTDDDADNGDTSKKKPPKGKELEEEPEDTEEELEPQGGYVVSIRKAISWTLIGILLVLLLVVLLLVLRRNLLLKRRQKRWDAEEIRDAVGWIFADTAGLLERLGFHRGNGSMQDLVQPINDRFGESYAREYEQMVMLNARAMFSSRMLEEEDREYAKTLHTATLQHLKNDAKWYKKLWMQWILCLF